MDGFHVTLAFLGSRPRTELPPSSTLCVTSAAEATALELVPKRYRETRSVGMVVLDDPSGEAARLAERLHGRLEALGVYEREARRWLPAHDRRAFQQPPARQRAEAPRLAALRPMSARSLSSEAAAFVSRLHPSGARYEILETAELKSERAERGG